MYAINRDTQSGDNTGGLAGIQDNFELMNIEYGGTAKDGGGAEAMRFIFKKGANFTFVHNEYPIDEARVAGYSKTKKVDGVAVEMTKAEKIEAAYKEQAIRIKHIMTKFMPENQIDLRAASLKELTAEVVKLLGEKYKGVKVRLKLIYNDKDYLKFPKIGFIELMSVTPTRLKINPQYDRIVPLEKDGETASAKKEDDLPF